MNTLLQMLLGAVFSTNCPQPAATIKFEFGGIPAQSAEICFAHRPKPLLPLRIV